MGEGDDVALGHLGDVARLPCLLRVFEEDVRVGDQDHVGVGLGNGTVDRLGARERLTVGVAVEDGEAKLLPAGLREGEVRLTVVVVAAVRDTDGYFHWNSIS